MNDLFYKVAEDAGIKIIPVIPGSLPADVQCTLADLKKFTKLIVLGCIGEIDLVNSDDHWHGKWDAGYEAGLSQAANTIKEHFGVEE